MLINCKTLLKRLYCMLWSQIKLTPYDFSDLQTTGDFNNRPGTRRFLKKFPSVFKYRTGAGRCLYMIMLWVRMISYSWVASTCVFVF